MIERRQTDSKIDRESRTEKQRQRDRQRKTKTGRETQTYTHPQVIFYSNLFLL